METKLTNKELWFSKRAYGFENRFEDTVKFLKEEDIFMGIGSRIADCGEENPLKVLLEIRLNKKIHSIDWNFNYPKPINKDDPFECYNVILCFEVLEHVFNPLTFLESLVSLLSNDGCIILTIPRVWPQWMRSKHHFHEIPSDRLEWLFQEAGLKIVKKDKLRLRGRWYYHVYGIRPMLRFFWKTRIYKLAKIN